ncbi:MAG: pilin [bacterium]|nr:pilin [bacterium]
MKQKIYKKIVILSMALLAATFVFSAALPVLALDINSADTDKFWGDNTERQYVADNSGLSSGTARDPRKIATDIIKVILGFLGIIAVVIILFAGFKWMTAGGNEENVAAAKKMLIAGVIGLIIILSAFALASFVITALFGATTGTN